MSENKDQQHPQEKRDRSIVESLLQGNRNNYNQVELARLRIRYSGFPGARDIQRDLDVILQRWQITEEELFEITRQLHEVGQVYRSGDSLQGQEDWS